MLAERAVAERKAQALVQQPGADVNTVSADHLGDAILGEVVGGSLFSSHIVAVIEDVGATPTEVVDQLVAVAADPGPELCLILVHGGGNKGKGLIDKLKKAKVETVTVAAMKPWEVWKFAAAEAKRQRLRMTQEAAQALVDAVGSDLRTIVGAVSQLVADAEGDEIDVPLIRRYFAGRSEVTSFNVADAVMAGNPSVAMERLRWALGTGAPHVLVTSAMGSNFRAMGKYLEAQGRRMSDADLAKQLGIPFFKVKDYAKNARLWSTGGVARAIQLIAKADAEVKGAATDPDYALEAMVLGVLAERETRR